MANYDQYQQALKQLEFQEDQYAKTLSDARAEVGVFSEHAVEDARGTFWESYGRGVSFAKRMSYFDALYMAIGSMRRDESLVSLILNWLLQVAMNFAVGMVSALISFVFHVGSLIMSYQASPVSGVSFFVLAFSGAFSVIASFIVGAYMFTATTYFAVVQVSKMAIENERANQQRLHQHVD